MESYDVRKPFDCTELFPGYNHARCQVKGSVAQVQLLTETATLNLEMNIDRIHMFLERCRAAQQVKSSRPSRH